MSNLVPIRPIRTKDDYQAALSRIEVLLPSEVGSSENDELDILVALVQTYEKANYPWSPADPVAAVLDYMAEHGLRQTDLIPYFGASSRVSDFVNRKRELSIEQIRRLHRALGIPLECLIAEAPTSSAA
ncbi:MAG: helix-turn-helix domain-containing protein [Fimbriimonas sp.]